MIAVFLLLLAQTPSLNQRVQQFYQLNIDKKWQEAAELVAADSRNDYYGITNRSLKGFAIDRIESLGTDRAVAFVVVSLQSPDDPNGTIRKTVATTWELESGEWRWYVQRSPW